MARVYNFSAGPSVLPEVVLKEAAEEMMDYRGTGMSVMEMSHRSKAYDTIIKEAEQDLRDLLLFLLLLILFLLLYSLNIPVLLLIHHIGLFGLLDPFLL